LHRNELYPPSVNGQLGATSDVPCVRGGVDASRLEGRDLRHVEDVEDVDAVAGDLDPAEAVDREVAEWMCGRGRDPGQVTKCHKADDEELLHRASLLAVGAQRTEKWGLSASARLNQLFAS